MKGSCQRDWAPSYPSHLVLPSRAIHYILPHVGQSPGDLGHVRNSIQFACFNSIQSSPELVAQFSLEATKNLEGVLA